MSQKIAPVARGGASCYFTNMAKEWVRRLPVLLIALLLAAEITTHAIHATNIGAETMGVAATCVLTQEKCGSRGDDNVLTLDSCSALNCNNAMTFDAANVEMDMLLVGLASPVAAPAIKGHKDSPDPHPPRLGIPS